MGERAKNILTYQPVFTLTAHFQLKLKLKKLFRAAAAATAGTNLSSKLSVSFGLSKRHMGIMQFPFINVISWKTSCRDLGIIT